MTKSEEEKVPTACQEENVAIASQEEKEAVASQEETGAAVGEGEEQSPSVEVQGTGDNNAKRNGSEVIQGTDDNDAKRNGSEVDSIGESKQHDFQLVKLARNGMVYISIPSRSPGDLVKFVDSILKEFHTKSRAAPRYLDSDPAGNFLNKECELHCHI